MVKQFIIDCLRLYFVNLKNISDSYLYVHTSFIETKIINVNTGIRFLSYKNKLPFTIPFKNVQIIKHVLSLQPSL